MSPGVELPRCPPHFKCWLEVVDKRHRYGANLRVYFKYWNDKVRTPDSGSFWSWLDGGPLHGMALPECPECPRPVLDSDVVRYCAQHEQAENLVSIGKAGLLYQHDAPLDTSTGSAEWIFVLSHENRLYAHPKIASASPRFHHSSFLAGAAVAAAGKLEARQGRLVRLSPHSGHYRPGRRSVVGLLRFLNESGVDLEAVRIDMQRFLPKTTMEKVSKKETTQMVGAREALEGLEQILATEDNKDREEDEAHATPCDFEAVTSNQKHL